VLSLLGVHWWHHYRTLHWIKHSNLTLYWLNVVFCFFLTLVPLAIKLLFMGSEFVPVYSSIRSATEWFCALVMFFLGLSHLIVVVYILHTPLLHPQSAEPIDGKLRRLVLLGVSCTSLVAVFERIVAGSGWRGSWYLYFLSPLINSGLFIFFSGSEPTRPAIRGNDTLSYHFLADPTQHPQGPAAGTNATGTLLAKNRASTGTDQQQLQQQQREAALLRNY